MKDVFGIIDNVEFKEGRVIQMWISEIIKKGIKVKKKVSEIIENFDFKEGQAIKMKNKKFNAISKLLQTKPGNPGLPQITLLNPQRAFIEFINRKSFTIIFRLEIKQ